MKSAPIDFNVTAVSHRQVKGKEIAEFDLGEKNRDDKTVDSFGEEWEKFNRFTDEEIESIGDEYFDIVPDHLLHQSTLVMDAGCGSGRWSRYLAPKVGWIEAIDPSKAIYHAAAQNDDRENIRFSKADINDLPFQEGQFDFVFSLGVLHHIPDTEMALSALSKQLKQGGHLLIYLYYALDNRGPLYKLIFHLSNSVRYLVCRMPGPLKRFFCDLLAILFYLPFILISSAFMKMGLKSLAKKVPLHYYVGKSWFVVRNDSLDRFGTPLEQRFSRKEITTMLERTGFEEIVFSEEMPYWHAIAKKK